MIRQTRPNAMRDLTISAIWIVVCVLFLNVDRHRIVALRAAGQHVPAVRWIQIPLWFGMLVFWLWNGWKAWRRIRAKGSAGE